MSEPKPYDVAIIGGGLAGLTASVLLVRKGFSVILFEKETYPFHKVCGEYISMESRQFLTQEIGLPLDEMNISHISKLLVTSPSGNELHADLAPGGFGISRYLLDNKLKEIAVRAGVSVLENCRAEEIVFEKEIFTIKTSLGSYISRTCCGSWGKRSNLDVKWKRPFIFKKSDRLNNYAGIKYHITADLPHDLIALHNFKDGYCGIVKIEDDKYCVCWFTKASNIKKSGNSIEKTEQEILSKNPHLHRLFSNMKKLPGHISSISQVSLSTKKSVENNVLMLGDAAGMISPLCGNGMSMAMHSAKIAAIHISLFLRNEISREKMEANYTSNRKEVFGTRITAGRVLQSLFGNITATEILVNILKRSRYLTKKIIRFTHGQPF